MNIGFIFPSERPLVSVGAEVITGHGEINSAVFGLFKNQSTKTVMSAGYE